ncbi:protease complex subunit PrcB family protein [Mechercharimyces sp. CAU 1602]|uniref:protease complex subunit PrcB family protein n=1 Tax=Mechercharimyces sp. CAU 1602 TaxID=2973933 RepID=UPI002162A55C|nr:protease complex subunit PrcB family protein [Mechercharimyces sp. CAU 1602]MCS1350175.1 protease complex subunit PrcB family protein [Mechercharimyces sp. CAU 1602]
MIKRHIAKLTMLSFVLILAGCGTGNAPDESTNNDSSTGTQSSQEAESGGENGTMVYEKVTAKQLPDTVKAKVNEIKEEGGGHSISENEQTYLILGLGQRNTGGYQIEVTKVERKEDTVHVYAQEVTPPEGAMVTQAITYPTTVISLDNVDEQEVEFTYHIEEAK